ncbi:MAG: UDP-N-acetylmuramate dehydrogenase [Planctomycetota bacterium]
MNWWNDFADDLERDAPLGRLTWFKLGGRARYMYRPRDPDSLARLVVRAAGQHIPVRVLGAGANVLVSDDGFDGVVVRLDQPEFRRVQWHEAGATVGGGVDLMPLAKECCTLGLAGMECMAGIPATVGGAVKMNAGGRFGEFGDVVREVDLLRSDGAFETWSHDRIGFGYRRTRLQDGIVLSARLEFAEDDPDRVRQTFDEYFDYKSRSQPLKDSSAGCIFKNPKGRSAGALIDRAGLKGVGCGQAYVSDRHANFIVTGKGATASDVLRLVDLIRERVHRLFGALLELEVDVW